MMAGRGGWPRTRAERPSPVSSVGVTGPGSQRSPNILTELADSPAAQETRAALEELLVAPRLAGKAGRALAARSPFRGRTRGGDLDAYIAQLLAETDMRLGVCDWGYCLYRRETSACRGSDREPNPVL